MPSNTKQWLKMNSFSHVASFAIFPRIEIRPSKSLALYIHDEINYHFKQREIRHDNILPIQN